MSSEHPVLTEWMYIRLSLHLYGTFNIEIVLSCLLGATDSQMPARAKNEQLSRSWYVGPHVVPVKYLFVCENGFQKLSMRMIKESKIMTMIRMNHLENI